MNKLVNGEWRTGIDASVDTDGEFVRQSTIFRDQVRDESDAEFPVEAGRYHLYISYACPWAHRTLIARRILGLEEAIDVSVVDPYRDTDGWMFTPEKDGCTADPHLGADYLRELYVQANPDVTCRVTVPVLWDTRRETIVNNESRDIVRLFSTAFRRLAANDVELAPADRRGRIDSILDAIYSPINNGVYRAGFAGSQTAYDTAIDELFESLNHWNAVLSNQRFLVADGFTEADICLFTTLIRFDPVYHTHFKCNVNRIVDYDNLWPYLRDIYQIPGVAETVRFDHIKDHYYRTHPDLNPKRIVARGPDLEYENAHDRHELPGNPPRTSE